MRIGFLIFISIGFFGFLYNPGWYSFVSLVYISFSCSPFFFASVIVRNDSVKTYGQLNGIWFWILFGVGLLNLVVIAESVGVGFKEIFSFEQVLRIALDSTYIRYIGDTQSNSGSPLLLAISLWLIYRTGTNENAIPVYKKVLSFVPVLMYTILTTEKWPSYLGISFFLLGIFAANDNKGSLRLFSKQIKYGLVILVIMILSVGMRNGFDSEISEFLNVMLHYVFAQYTSLGYWILNKYMEINISFGQLTFIGPLSFLGIIERNSGVFVDNYTLNGRESNIYTSFRYIIQDFSLLGPIVINSILAYLYVKLYHLNFVFLSRAIRIFVIFCALLSISVTPFVHNSVMIGMLLAIGSDCIPRVKFKF